MQEKLKIVTLRLVAIESVAILFSIRGRGCIVKNCRQSQRLSFSEAINQIQAAIRHGKTSLRYDPTDDEAILLRENQSSSP